MVKVFIQEEVDMHETAKNFLEKYEKAKTVRESFIPLFEECYEYALPQRESFYTQAVGERRDDKIFDETAVVGVQEFASRLQQGLVPNFARWADFTAGSEVPKEERDSVNNQLDEVTEYVFEVIQNSNFGQEVHESFMDLAVGTGVLHVQEGDAVHPVIFLVALFEVWTTLNSLQVKAWDPKREQTSQLVSNPKSLRRKNGLIDLV